MVRGTGNQEGLEGLTMYPCPLDESVQVVEFPFGADAKTLAMIVMSNGEGVILLNSNLPEEHSTDAHKMAIFAHELGHLAMGEVESEADMWAIEMLRTNGFNGAAQLLIDRCNITEMM